jgi:hypothetical protein
MHYLLSVLLLAALPVVELRTLEGEQVVGELEACDAAVVRIKAADGSHDFTAEQVWEITPSAPATSVKNPEAVIAVALTDGTLLWASDYRVQNGVAKVTLGNGEIVEAPTSGVASVKFAIPTELDAQWQDILKKEVAGDLVVVKRDGALDYLEGVLGDTDVDGTFDFSLDGDSIPVKRNRVAAITYFHKATDAAPRAVAVVTDAAGNRYAAAELQLVDGKLAGKTVAGATWSVPLEALANVDYSQGRVAYLSDLAPVKQEWTPYVGGTKLPPSVAAFYAPKRNRGFEAQDLRLAGQRFSKGLAFHSRTEAVYRLDGQYRRFQALAGIDDRTEGLGAVRLVIRGDDRQLWEGEIAAGDEPVLLNLATDNVRALSILVDYGAGQDTADHLNLCDAKVIR